MNPTPLEFEKLQFCNKQVSKRIKTNHLVLRRVNSNVVHLLWNNQSERRASAILRTQRSLDERNFVANNVAELSIRTAIAIDDHVLRLTTIRNKTIKDRLDDILQDRHSVTRQFGDLFVTGLLLKNEIARKFERMLTVISREL